VFTRASSLEEMARKSAMKKKRVSKDVDPRAYDSSSSSSS
jgi:hypothetical protein